MNGHSVWYVRVSPREMTCLACGETFTEGDACVNCATNDDGSKVKEPPPSVPTVSYLRDGEWVRG